MNPNATSFIPGGTLAIGGAPRRVGRLQTAVTNVYNIDGVQSATARLVFDTAGFRSYITADLAKDIGAKIIDKDSGGLAVFGAQRGKYVRYNVVEFDVQARSGGMQRVVADVTAAVTLPSC